MNTKNLHILLSIVEKNGGVDSLLNEGLSYQQISDLTNSAIIQELIVYENNMVVLSTLGKATLVEMRNDLKTRDKEDWIKKEISAKIPRIDLDFIFLP